MSPATTDRPVTGTWLLSFICCGRRNGYQVCESWEAADEFRCHYNDAEGHQRAAILTELSVPARRGYHDYDPSEFDRIVAP